CFAGMREFYPSLTAMPVLEFSGNFYDGWDALRARSLLEHLGVRADLKIEQLSKGDRVKLSLISALAHRPSLLILDEPTSGLDPLVRMDLLHFLSQRAENENLSTVPSSELPSTRAQIT